MTKLLAETTDAARSVNDRQRFDQVQETLVSVLDSDNDIKGATGGACCCSVAVYFSCFFRILFH